MAATSSTPTSAWGVGLATIAADGATRDTFLSYIDRWYRPERLVVGIGGKLGDGLDDDKEVLLHLTNPNNPDTDGGDE